MNAAKNALFHFFIQDASEIDAHIDINDVFSGTSETKKDQSSSEEMLRLVGQTSTLLLTVGAIISYLNW